MPTGMRDPMNAAIHFVVLDLKKGGKIAAICGDDEFLNWSTNERAVTCVECLRRLAVNRDG